MFRTELQKTCSLEDLFCAKIDEHTNNGWETIASGIKNLPENFELSVDLFSSGVIIHAEQRLYLCASSTYTGNSQPNQAVWVGFNRPATPEYGVRNNTSDWHLGSISNAHTQYHTFKIIRQGSTYRYYVDDSLMGTLNYNNLSNYDDFTLCWMNWASNYTFKFKNLKLKAL